MMRIMGMRMRTNMLEEAVEFGEVGKWEVWR